MAMGGASPSLFLASGDMGVRSVEDAAIFKESDRAASCRYFQFGSLPGDTAKRRRDAREPVRNL